ncbi:MAG: hypothetical protein G01um10147_792 [Microgenomates group bacterium Gr01-1014_7]|nr:MAG: hypothetical protein G01um10147_792 [Microgenomates group bacterium Gr01-1014_7]
MSQVSIKQLIEEGKATEEDARYLASKGTSLARCEICPQLFETKDIRRKPHLCDKHKRLSAAVKRYQNPQKYSLTEEEKAKIINSKTRSIGPFKYGK